MDKIHEGSQKNYGRSASEPTSDLSVDSVSLQPPAFQLKATAETASIEDKENVVEQPYQMAADGEGTPVENPNSDSEDSKPNNTGLPTQLKSGIENLSGFSLDDVKVHRNSDKPAQLQAHAYAQGTDIHLGPGQEKHLPHEAWHVVQQKQGRVKATTQMKGKGVNDDSGLEKEADVMGAKAMQHLANSAKQLQKGHKKSNTVQRYAAKKDNLSEEVFNTSINEHFVVGTGYPNHELYVQNANVLEALNENISDGLLEFTVVDTQNFNFGGEEDKVYHKLLPRHKSEGINAINSDELNQGIKTELVKNHAKANDDFQEGNFQDSLEEFTANYTSNTEVSRNVYEFSMNAEYIRKNLSQLGYTNNSDETTGFKELYALVYNNINNYLNGEEGASKTLISKSLTVFIQSLPEASENVLLESIRQKALEMTRIIERIPDVVSANDVKKGHLNHQLEAIDRGELLLPRGCDLVAATTMGKGNDENALDAFAMTFNMKDETVGETVEHHHFATKLLSDGTDFITIEGFAKGGYNIFDDTWEIFLHGNEEEETDAFHNYTESRYEFFPDAKEFLDKKRSDNEHPELSLETKKNFEKKNSSEAFAFYNATIKSGGAESNLKDIGTREDEQRQAIQQAKGDGFTRLNEFPVKAKCVDENEEFDAFLEESKNAVFGYNAATSANEVLNLYRQKLTKVRDRSYQMHLDRAEGIARAKDVFDDAESNGFLDKLEEWSDACSTKRDNTLGIRFIKRGKLNKASQKLVQIRSKWIEIEEYFDKYNQDPSLREQT